MSGGCLVSQPRHLTRETGAMSSGILRDASVLARVLACQV